METYNDARTMHLGVVGETKKLERRFAELLVAHMAQNEQPSDDVLQRIRGYVGDPMELGIAEWAGRAQLSKIIAAAWFLGMSFLDFTAQPQVA